jgi:hypothetical protein
MSGSDATRHLRTACVWCGRDESDTRRPTWATARPFGRGLGQFGLVTGLSATGGTVQPAPDQKTLDLTGPSRACCKPIMRYA